jgi:hypothetical protein
LSLFLIIMSGLFAKTSLSICIPWFHKAVTSSCSVIIIIIIIIIIIVTFKTLQLLTSPSPLPHCCNSFFHVPFPLLSYVTRHRFRLASWHSVTRNAVKVYCKSIVWNLVQIWTTFKGSPYLPHCGSPYYPQRRVDVSQVV